MSRNEAFAPWQCPLCGGALQGENDLKCEKGHCFDRAKEGYWHLLPVQSMRTKAPGDSKEMVAARRAFLNAGYYGIFGAALGELCAEYGVPAAPDAPLHLLDAGCGEGWYDRCIAQNFAESGKALQLAGFDIAKPAVRLAAKALPVAQYAVASSFSQPVRTGWADLLLNCFSPFAQEEFQRVTLSRPSRRASVLMNDAFSLAISTDQTLAAPLEANSNATAPVPPKRSRTFRSSNSYSLSSTLKSPSLAKSVVGLAL